MFVPSVEMILAISDEALCGAFRQMLAAGFPGMRVIAECHSAAEAMKAIFTPAIPPSRFIVMDAPILHETPDFIRQLGRRGSECACFLVQKQPDFDQLLFALRCGVLDCFFPPLSAQAFSEAVERIKSRLQRERDRIPTEANEASRYLFWRNDVRKLSFTHMSIAQTNKEYGTRFSEGLFRALFVELSASHHEESVVDNAELQMQIIRMSSQVLHADCFDILFNRHANGVSMLLNFSVGKRGLIARQIDQLFFGLRREFGLENIEVTMAIGRVYSDFSKLPEVKQEILDARWARRQIGSGRMISAEDIVDKQLLPEQKHALDNLRSLILHYFELLDQVRARQYIDEFYTTFESVLPIREIRTFTRSLPDFLFQTYAAELAVYGDLDNLRHSYIARESTADTAEKLHKTTTDNIMDMMEKIELVVRRQYSQAVRDCIAYIANRHCSNIRLEELAELVHLSPQYLSSLFHKETGQTISGYIHSQKLTLAQSMLAHSTRNIAEIAEYLGFSDPHYFSRFFKARMQITPSEYRRLKQG